MTSFITFQALWIKTNASRQVTLSCGSDHEPQRGLPGYPGKRGRKGAIGNIGPKGDASIMYNYENFKINYLQQQKQQQHHHQHQYHQQQQQH